MNKEKLSEIKKQIKKHAPKIGVAALVVTTTAVIIKTITSPITWEELRGFDDVLQVVDGEERETLMKDPSFDLLRITEEEYMFVRNDQQ